MRRHLPPLVVTLAALTVVPTAVMLPTLSPPAATPRPVSAVVTALPLSGVDAAARRAEQPPAVALRATSGLGVVAAAMSRTPAVLTARKDTQRFDLVALSWTGGLPAGTHLQVKVREDGQWSDWHDLHTGADGPDATSAEGRAAASVGASDPLLTNGADGLQVRVDSATGTAPAGLRATLVDGGRSAADAPRAPAGTAAAATSQPALVTRAQWGADESLVTGSPSLNDTVQVLFLHHTDTLNAYSASEAYAQVRAVYTFHTKVRGWNDIGYNFLVDRFGKVYEGRRGSITDAVVGAHTGGFNTNSLGIATLGTFSTVGPSPAMLDGIGSVMAWKAAQYGIDPRNSALMTSSGGGTTFVPGGKQVWLRTISGHRDVGSTECPGNDLYPYLPRIRADVAARMKPDLVAPRTSADVVAWSGSSIGFTAAVPTVQRWWLMATSMCGTQPVRTLSGRTAVRITTSWDLRDTGGAPVAPGVYRLTMVTSSPVGAAPTWTKDVEVLPTLSSPAAACAAARIVGGDLPTSSVLAGRVAVPQSTSAVLVAGGAVLDQLVAAPLAKAKQAPLLLSGATALAPNVAAEISGRGITQVWIVGGTAAVGPAVEAQLRGLGVQSIVRLTGADRYATAAAVAREVGAPGRAAMIVSGENGRLADAVAAAGPAAATGRPLLLVTSKGVPAATASTLKALGVTSATVVGSTVTVPASVVTSLGKSGVTSRSRIAGADRYATAAAVATAFASAVGTDRVVVVPAPDSGLSWAALGAAQGRLTLLTDWSSVPAATSRWLTARPVTSVSLVSDPRNVSTGALRQLLATIG